ncbi:Uncharacterised protein [Bordetella pertussis]|nr:Uncharacterised protein [Bordetella pertussis]
MLQATSICACIPENDSSSMWRMVTCLGGRSSSMPARAYS